MDFCYQTQINPMVDANNNSSVPQANGPEQVLKYADTNCADFGNRGSAKKTYGVLMADDSADDRFFLRRAMDDCERFCPVAEVEDGAAAIAYLKGEGQFADRSRYAMPDLLLLDLKMPRATGFDVLQWLKTVSFPALKVAVLSGSVLDSDKEKCKELGAHAYFTKCASISQIKAMLHEVETLLDQTQHAQAA
jgi:CheY-like chemotaxis protein